MAIAELTERLRARRPEIEQTLLTRVYALEDPRAVGDLEYVQGLKAAVNAALSYGLSAIEDTGPLAPIPPELLAQARRAARSGVSLDTVLRRYLAGHTLLSDFIAQEAPQGAPARTLRAEAILLDRLIEAVASEYREELKVRCGSTHERRTECVKRLLAGELADTASLNYDLSAWHIGVVGVGPGAREAIRELAAAVDRRLLLVCPGGKEAWAWLGGRRPVEIEAAMAAAQSALPDGVTLALSEAASGLTGWRFTHRQAVAALPIAQRAGEPLTRYGDVALLASILHDDLLRSSLEQLYLAPLAGDRDGGKGLRRTLRAYFAAGRNAASAAAALGVSRQTVNNRLAAAESRIGRCVDSCAVELETALRLQGWYR